MKKIVAIALVSSSLFFFQFCFFEKSIIIDFFNYNCIEDYYINDDYKGLENSFAIGIKDTNKLTYSFTKENTSIILYARAECEKKCVGKLIQKKDSVFITFNVIYPKTNLLDSNCDCVYKINYKFKGVDLKKKYYFFFLKPKIVKE